MALRVKDLAATALTALAVLAFAAAHESWGVPLVGDSTRWAAGAVLLLGMATCALGSPGRGRATVVSSTLGILALALAVVALATGSMTALSLLVADTVVLWAVSTALHVAHRPRRPIPA